MISRSSTILILLICAVLLHGCRPGMSGRERRDDAFYRRIRQAHRLIIKGKRAEGAAGVKAAVSIDPARFEYYDAATAVLSGVGMKKESIELLEQGVRRIHEPAGLFVKSPDDHNRSTLYTRLGDEYWHAGSVDRAEKAFEAAIRLDKDNAWARNDLGYMYAERGVKLQRALVLTLRAMDMKPNDGNIVDSVGWTYFKMGDKDRAVEYLEKAVQLEPGISDLRVHLGMAYEACGNPRSALVEYSKALKIAPQNKTARLRRDRLMLGLSKK